MDEYDTLVWVFVAEFVATLLFLYISLTTLVGTIRIGAGNVGLLETAWSFGGMIFILVYCIAGISGTYSLARLGSVKQIQTLICSQK